MTRETWFQTVFIGLMPILFSLPPLLYEYDNALFWLCDAVIFMIAAYRIFKVQSSSRHFMSIPSVLWAMLFLTCIASMGLAVVAVARSDLQLIVVSGIGLCLLQELIRWKGSK